MYTHMFYWHYGNVPWYFYKDTNLTEPRNTFLKIYMAIRTGCSNKKLSLYEE